MAGTRGLAQFRGRQLNDKIIRNRHFDEHAKIDEKYIDLRWSEHREILENTKIDVWVQANGHIVSGTSSIDVTDAVSGRPVSTGLDVEGVVIDEKVELRKAGTDDFPKIDPLGEKVYGRLRKGSGSDDDRFFLDFFVKQGDVENAHTFSAQAEDIDFRFIVRTNLSAIPVDALVSGGSGFVEGATDAKAYMNLLQLMKDLYGTGGVLNGDGHAILPMSITDQITDEAQRRAAADQEIVDHLADSTGAGMVGVVLDPQYSGMNVQEVLINLASRLMHQEQNSGADVEAARTRDQDSPNGYFKAGDFGTLAARLVNTENKVDEVLKSHETSLTVLETQDQREVYEAAGGETQYLLAKGVAKPNSLFLSLNGQIQAPGINYEEILDAQGYVTGVNFDPDFLQVHEGKPDVLLLWYKKVLS